LRRERESGGDAVPRPVDIETGLTQTHLQPIPQERIIFDEQDAHAGLRIQRCSPP
jgi:hypothetical protein